MAGGRWRGGREGGGAGGGQHNDAVHLAHDTRRAAALHKSGWRILRFWNNEVMENIEGVLAVIAQALTRPTTHEWWGDLSRWER